MHKSIDRRHFLKTTGIIGLLGMGMLGKISTNAWAKEVSEGASNAEKLGWHLSCQAWTFNRFTFFETVDKVESLGLKYIEAFPNQRFNKEREDISVNESLPDDARKEIKTKLGDADIKLINYGVCKLSKNEEDSRRIFDFAKDMGIETLVSEPTEDMLEMLDGLCGEYGINIALHNHPNPSHYWDPDIVLKACEGRSKHIGACADTGHWDRSGLNPVECLKKLEGRIISLHFKDLNQKGKDAHDVPWGAGVCDIKGMLSELRRQNFRGVFSIEYEYNWENSLPDVAQSVAYFNKVAGELAAQS